MIYSNVELHNVAEAVPVGDGVRFLRVPENVQQHLNPVAQMRVTQPDCCEIRFKADGPVKVTLSSEGFTKVTPFFGVFDSRTRFMVRYCWTGRGPGTASRKARSGRRSLPLFRPCRRRSCAQNCARPGARTGPRAGLILPVAERKETQR